MAVIHNTTMSPGKLELLASWLPTRPWYVGTGREPQLTKAGGFRLDDPEGEVGIEFMVVTDGGGDRPYTYHLPLSYRGASLDGTDEALIGTSEHGVLGRRWVYDGTHDPVLVARLLALLQSRAEPQAQSESGTPDRSVVTTFAGPAGLTAVGAAVVGDGPSGTDLLVETTRRDLRGGPASGGPAGGPVSGGGQASGLAVHVVRVLRPEREVSDGFLAGALGHVTAGWRTPDGAERRGPFAVLRKAAT